MLELKLIELYCLICHLYDTNIGLKHQRLSNNSKPQFTDSELITCYFFGMLQNHCQQKAIYDYIKNHWSAWFPDLPSYQAFNNRLNNCKAVFKLSSKFCSKINSSNRIRLFPPIRWLILFPWCFPPDTKPSVAKRLRRSLISAIAQAKIFIIMALNSTLWQFVESRSYQFPQISF